ncbi:cytochrome c [Caulobacter sp. 602-1]|uniref:c-type cytochrome n=1 Tax=Caulobacter sp. 602-1 TaxID=2492472 RepID=UPI000F62E093|nr:cytochrome c [Caulobacter sp. 602-1]RRN63857.1 cytochrome c [Caulobacter sp. 602-1]
MTGRRRLLAGAAAALVALGGALAWWMLPPRAMDFAGDGAVALADYRGPSPVGVPAELAGASLVARGKYLTEAADCEACHTATGGTPYAGGRAFITPFGTLYAPNITADVETGIGAWSDADFLRALHKGIARNGQRLYPAFPYESYTLIADEDVKAIRAYLFSLPPRHAPSPPNRMKFPFDQRWLMGFWSLFYNSDRRFAPLPERSPQWNRGAYLVEALGHCGDCHTPRNLAQALDNRRKFAGGVVDGWRAYNITQDRTAGLGDWTDAQIADYLRRGHTVGRGSAGGPMAEAIDLSLSKLSPGDIDAMVAYLRAIPPVRDRRQAAVKTAPAADSHRTMATAAPLGAALGKQMFEGACVSCHGWSGQSLITPDATLVGARSVNDAAAANVALAVLSGVQRPAPSLSMPAFARAYSDAEIAAVSNYVTARFGAKASSLTAKDVAKLRAQSAP